MGKSKNTTSLIVILTLIMVSAILTLGILLYVRSQNLESLTVLATSSKSNSILSTFSVPTPSGDVTVSIVKTTGNKYNLLLDTKGTNVTAIDLRFNISNEIADIVATKGALTELNDLFIGKTENGELIVQAGSLNGYTGSGVLANLSLVDSNLTTDLTLLPTSFVNAGTDISINELSVDTLNYSFTLD